jgi:pimeloyl-ACP methyl ester carboxylesterase
MRIPSPRSWISLRWLATDCFAITDEATRAARELSDNDADMFFGIEVVALQQWQFGATEAERITVPVLSMVGSESDPAFFEMEALLRGLLSNLKMIRVPKTNHLLCLQEPQPVAEALAQFFAGHPLT